MTAPLLAALPKPWYESKTVWFNVAMTFGDSLALTLSLADVYSKQYPDPRWPLVLFVLTLFQGIGNVILRVWFTGQPIQGGVYDPA